MLLPVSQGGVVRSQEEPAWEILGTEPPALYPQQQSHAFFVQKHREAHFFFLKSGTSMKIL